jgi:hypothetical protein
MIQNIKKLLFLILALCCLGAAQTNPITAFMPSPRFQFLNANGNPDAGGFLFTYAAGTSTPLATYHLDTLGNLTPNQNPLTLDALGSAEVRLTGACYKMQLQDSTGAQIWQIDQICDTGLEALADSVLLNPTGGALQTISGPLSVTGLYVGGGSLLATSNQSGTGILCMTVSCVEITPSINGVTVVNSPGTYITIANSTTTGTSLNTLTKFASASTNWIKRNDTSGSGSGSPQSAAAFSVSLTNPSTIIVLAQGPVGTFSVADTAGNTYQDCGPGQVVYNSSANGVQCFYALNTHTTASNVVSFSSSAGGTMSVTATEWTGGAIVSPIDVTQNSGGNASTGTGGGQNVTSNGTNTSAADLIIGIAAAQTGPLSVGSGFTGTSSQGLEYQIGSGPGTIAALWSDPTNNDSYGAMVIGFLPSTGSNSNAVITAITDTSGIEGICVAGCGTSGNATIQKSGSSTCFFDGATNANDYVINSVLIPGNCHDAGPTAVSNLVGRVTTSNSTSGAYSLVLESQAGGASSGAGIICANAGNSPVAVAGSSPQAIATCSFQTGVLNKVGKTIRLTGTMNSIAPGSGSSTLYWGVGSSPTISNLLQQAISQIGGGGIISSGSIVCTTTATGTSGTLSCGQNETNDSTASLPNGPYVWQFTSVNLTAPLFVGQACSFTAPTSSSKCTSYQLLVEQLN